MNFIEFQLTYWRARASDAASHMEDDLFLNNSDVFNAWWMCMQRIFELLEVQ